MKNTLGIYIIMLAVMLALAFIFVEGLERQVSVDHAKLSKHFESLENQGRRLALTGDGPREYDSWIKQLERRRERGR